MTKNNQDKIRVMIVDDHFMARIGLAAAINQEDDMEVVAEACTGAEALEFFPQFRPSVVTMDYELPDQTGPQAAERIRQQYPGARLLLLSAYEGEERVYQAARAGICGYLTKTSDCSEVLEAIREIHQGGTAFSPVYHRRIAERRLRPDFTEREIAILLQLAKGNSNKMIAVSMGFSESLIKRELVRLFDKLGAKDRAHAVMLAVERGVVR
jgi:two-component system, NarL family, response regulator